MYCWCSGAGDSSHADSMPWRRLEHSSDVRTETGTAALVAGVDRYVVGSILVFIVRRVILRPLLAGAHSLGQASGRGAAAYLQRAGPPVCCCQLLRLPLRLRVELRHQRLGRSQLGILHRERQAKDHVLNISRSPGGTL